MRLEEFRITVVEDIQSTSDLESFLLSDLDRNWWEIAYLKN